MRYAEDLNVEHTPTSTPTKQKGKEKVKESTPGKPPGTPSGRHTPKKSPAADDDSANTVITSAVVDPAVVEVLQTCVVHLPILTFFAVC